MAEDDADLARLRSALRSANRHERAVAVIELGDRGDRALLPELEALRDDPDDLVAVAADVASWRLGASLPSSDRVARALGSDDQEVMQTAVEALDSMGEAVVPLLADLIRARSPASTRIVRVLGDIGGDEARSIAESAAQSDDESLAAAARTVLHEWED